MHFSFTLCQTPIKHLSFIAFIVVILKQWCALAHYFRNRYSVILLFSFSLLYILLLILFSRRNWPTALLKDIYSKLFNWKSYLLWFSVFLEIFVKIFLQTNVQHHLFTFFHYTGSIILLKIWNHTFFVFIRTNFILKYSHT